MDIVLTPAEARIVGALIEKQVTTPEYYPLTLNALVSACNQKSNREPVLSLAEEEVSRALDELRFRQLVWLKHTAGSRVPKYAHALSERFEFGPAELACLCVLLLRGPQTPGEIRARSGRLHEFPALADVEAALGELMDRPNGPLVTRLPRQPGHKEARYAHLLCGPAAADAAGAALPPSPLAGAGATPDREAGPPLPAGSHRIEALGEEVGRLRAELDELRETLTRFMRQFD